MSDEISPEQYEDAFHGEKRTRALSHALDIRKFEIELYWKRATYFWTFIGATFAGYGAVQLASAPDAAIRTDLSVVLSCFGFVLSFAWFCVNKGSKQWQENWENHVDMLEDGEIGPLYKTVLKRPKPENSDRWEELVNGPGSYSVSKVNQIVSLFVTLLWLIVLSSTLTFSMSGSINWKHVLVVGLSIVTCIAIGLWGRTHEEPHRIIIGRRRETVIQPRSGANPDD